MGKKPTRKSKKAKFSLYLSEDVMNKVTARASEIDRSINYVVNNLLEKEFGV